MGAGRVCAERRTRLLGGRREREWMLRWGKMWMVACCEALLRAWVYEFGMGRGWRCHAWLL